MSADHVFANNPLCRLLGIRNALEHIRQGDSCAVVTIQLWQKRREDCRGGLTGQAKLAARPGHDEHGGLLGMTLDAHL